MKWIGITGSMGTGKSSVAKVLRELGYQVLDADELAKKQLEIGESGYLKVLESFGTQLLKSDKTIDRSKLAKVVFNNKHELLKLENIVHPLIQRQIQIIKNDSEKHGEKILFYDVPLLFEKNMQNSFDEIILVVADNEVQMQRIQERNNWTKEEIKKRLESQMPLDQKKLKSKFIIDNNGSQIDLRNQVLGVLSQILKPN
ncbi:MAG: dephospho-CoA kinase [Deltaproteobacteria bacterium]|nr:dephospho-CoA kinase [Deltaproteobacteria bacterium]